MQISACHIYMGRDEIHKVHVPFPAKSKRKPIGNVRLEITTFDGQECISVISDLFYRKFVITGKGKLKEIKADPARHE